MAGAGPLEPFAAMAPRDWPASGGNAVRGAMKGSSHDDADRCGR